MLLEGKNKFFYGVLLELVIFGSDLFIFIQATVNAKETGLVDFLGLDDGVDPVLLSFLETLDELLLLHQVLLILAEIVGADILNLFHLLVVPLLQAFAMRAALGCNGHNVGLEGICLLVHLALQFIFEFGHGILESVSIFN